MERTILKLVRAVKRLALLLILVLVAAVVSGCAGDRVYIEASEKGKALIEASMTGGRLTLDGPFKYCREPGIVKENGEKAITGSVCQKMLEAGLNLDGSETQRE